jgi:hypothetical protein
MRHGEGWAPGPLLAGAEPPLAGRMSAGSLALRHEACGHDETKGELAALHAKIGRVIRVTGVGCCSFLRPMRAPLGLPCLLWVTIRQSRSLKRRHSVRIRRNRPAGTTKSTLSRRRSIRRAQGPAGQTRGRRLERELAI